VQREDEQRAGWNTTFVVPRAQPLISDQRRSTPTRRGQSRRRRQPSSLLEGPWLRFDRNLSRELVHRRGLAEVLLADMVEVADDEFLLGTQLPRSHSFWSDRPRAYHDPLIGIEIARQACIAIPQRYYGVQPGWQFVSKDIEVRVVDLDAFTDDGSSPPEGVLRVRCADKRERHGTLSRMTVECELTIDETAAATLAGDLMCLPRGAYEGLRSQQRRSRPRDVPSSRGGSRGNVHAIDPARVGRALARNVVIGDSALAPSRAGERRYALIVDQSHPCFFDHPLDHLPGALLVEAYRQAAIATATGRGKASPAAAVTTACQVRLSDFAELDAPAECCARITDRMVDGRVRIGLDLHQFDAQIGEAHVEISFPSGTAREH
jgi:A-factor biosynthesis hotdog domain